MWVCRTLWLIRISLYVDLSTFPAVQLIFRQCYYHGYIWSIHSGVGGLGGLTPGAVPYFFHCAVHDYSLTSLQRGNADIIGILYMNTCLPELTEMLIGEPVNLSSWFDRSFCVSRTCPPVDLSTCQPVYQG